MSSLQKPFALGNFRPLYLRAGKGTVRMLKLKFMGANVDTKSYDFAHSIEGAERVAEMGFNWVFLAYNWGFPPEVESQDWQSFESTLNHFHQVGIKVFGYMQSSNCVYDGSYVDKDWYALDYYGKKMFYYTGRYFTSLSHHGWLSEVRERVRHLADMGTDGIFFDNPWQGGIGIDLGEMPLGFVGSYDTHSKKAYAQAYNGAEIPLVLDVTEPETQQYLRWRAQVATSALRDWVQTARDINPDIVITANNFDPIVHNTYVDMGMDLQDQAEIADVVMVEDFSLPRLNEDDSVVSNAITIGATQAHVNKPVTTNPLLNGIGFDRMWQPHYFKRMLAEGIGMNSPTVTRGSTFLHRNEFTMLLHRRYEKQRDALRMMNEWMQKHQPLIANRKAISPIAIYYPYQVTRWQWNETAPLFFAACQTLILNGYPLRIVGDEDDWQEVQTIIVPPGDVPGLEERLDKFETDGGRVIAIGKGRKSSRGAALWFKWKPIPHRIPNWRWLRKQINRGAIMTWRAYHTSRLVRWLGEKLDFHLRTTQSALFFVPPEKYQQELLSAINTKSTPHVESEYPVLLTGWRHKDGSEQWYVINYGNVTQRITLEMNRLVNAKVYAIGENTEPTQIVGSALMITIDVGKIIHISPPID